MTNRVVHFEIQAENPTRAAEFYREAFGWTVEKWDNPHTEYWIVMTAPADSKLPGINGGIIRRPYKAHPQEHGTNSYICTIQVANFDETAKRIFDAGGAIAMPKFAMKGMAWQGYFLDTEGNVFGLHQPDLNAE